MIYNSTKAGQVVLKSRLDYKYAEYLDSKPDIKFWFYRKAWIWYTDGFTGKRKKYYCGFQIMMDDGEIHHVEVKSIKNQVPIDKYLYAKNMLKNWRFVTPEEINEINKIPLP